MLKLPKKIHILLIENDKDSQILLITTLEQIKQFTFVFTTAQTLKSAIESINHNQFDLIFLNLDLPDSKGISTIDSIVDSFCKAPIIVLTPQNEKAYGLLAMQHGAQDFFIKDEYTAANLEKAIAYAIERSRLKNDLISTQLKQIRLLIIEDNEDYRFLLIKKLEKIKHTAFEFIQVSTVQDALLALVSNKIDLMFLDLNLPDSKHLSTLTALESYSQKIPIIVMTAIESDNLGILAVKHGAQDFFVKQYFETAALDKSITYALERSRLNQALLESSSSRYHELFENCGDCIVIHTLEGVIEDVNQKVCQLLQMSKYEILNRNILDFQNQEDHGKIKKEFQLLLEKKEYDLETCFITKTEDIVRVEIRATLSKTKGNENLVQAVIRDITQRKAKEEELASIYKEHQYVHKELQNLHIELNQIFNAATPMCVLSLADKNIIRANDTFYTVFELNLKDILHKNIDDLITASQFEKINFNKNDNSYELQKVKTDGETITFLVSTLPYKNAAGKIIGSIESYHDISKQEQAAKKLINNVHFLETFLDTIPNPVFYHTIEGIYLGCNNAFTQQIAGKNRQELIGRPCSDLEILIANYKEKNKQILKHKGTQQFEAGIICTDAVKREFLISRTTFCDTKGNVTGIVGIMFDVSSLKKTQLNMLQLDRQLQQSRKIEAIGTLAAGIAHEINTPIQFINDNTSFIADSVADLLQAFSLMKELINENETATAKLMAIEEKIDLNFLKEEIPKALEQSKEGLDNVTKIIKAMRDFSHVPLIDPKIAANINEAIETTITISKNEWKYVSEVKLKLSHSLPLVDCFISEVKQVFLNLIINAAQAIKEKNEKSPVSTEKGLITISTFLEKNFVCITVADSGCGIEEHHKDKVFDPFFTTKGVGKGSGQGLSLAYSCIVEKHDGVLSFDSVKGKGTTFKIKLPLKTKV